MDSNQNLNQTTRRNLRSRLENVRHRCDPISGSNDKAPTGAKMYADASYWLSLGILSILGISWGYSRGWKDGHSEGYVRGRAIAQALKEINK